MSLSKILHPLLGTSFLLNKLLGTKDLAQRFVSLGGTDPSEMEKTYIVVQ